MGNHRSGRPYGKACTDERRPLDVRLVFKGGWLTPGAVCHWQWLRRGAVQASITIAAAADRVLLIYTNRNANVNGGTPELISTTVPLDWTPCALGGRRAWWRCPLPDCGRRVAVLFGGRVYACRQCHDLAYRSQRESAAHRAIGRADTLRRRLGWRPGIAYPNGDKPKGMHWQTFARLEAAHDQFASRAVAGLRRALGVLEDRAAESPIKQRR